MGLLKFRCRRERSLNCRANKRVGNIICDIIFLEVFLKTFIGNAFLYTSVATLFIYFLV